MGNYKRCPVVFNLDNPAQNELYEWCMDNSSNFSDFARSILFAYRESKRSGGVATISSVVSNQQSAKGVSDADKDAISSMF